MERGESLIMKKLAKTGKRLLVILMVAALFILPMGGCKKKTVGEITVINYGEYLDPDMIDKFTKETGIKVNYEEAITPEEMYTKYSSGAIKYDLVCTADYMMQKMINEGEFIEIPWNQFQYKDNIGEKYYDFCKAFDPENKYSMPYFWGTLGILYDTTKVKGPVDSWDVLFDGSYAGEIIMQNSMRDTFMVALKELGYSINTDNPDELREAQQLLIKQKPDVQAYLVDEGVERTTIFSEGESKPDTDLYKYLTSLRAKLSRRKGADIAAVRNKIEDFQTFGGGVFTFRQFQRLFLVFEIYKRWQKELGLGDLRSFHPSQISVRDHAIWYLIYKTVRVLETYPDFFAGGLRDYEIPHYFFSEDLRNRLINKWFELLYKDIHGLKTHLTLKIRQTINYLSSDVISSCFMKDKEEKYEVKTVLSISGHKYYLDCSQYYDIIKNVEDLASLLPPPFFVYDYVISRDDSAFYPLSRMSSGERQLLNSASSIVYHLKLIR